MTVGGEHEGLGPREAGPAARALSLRRIGRETGHRFAAHWVRLLALAALVEVPLVVMEVTLHVAPGVRSFFDRDAVLPLVLVVAVYGSLSHYFFAGVLERFVTADREGAAAPTMGAIGRELPWGRLVVADLALTGSIALGLLLLVVPGLVVATWFALTLPLINIEDRGVADAFRRSAELVRGQAWTVAFVTISTLVVPEAVLAVVVASVSTGHVVADAAVHAAVATVLLPLAALPIVIVAYDLIERRAAA